MQNTSYSWNHSTEVSAKASKGLKRGISFWPHGKMLGGSSSMNAMFYVRGNNRDYDQWEQMGNPSWNWLNVLEYFKKSEGNGDFQLVQNDPKNHRSDGLLKVNAFSSTELMKIIVLRAAQELGYKEVQDINGDTHTGFVQVQGTLERGRRYSTAKAFLNSAKDRPNLNIIKNAFVKKINIGDKGQTKGVTFDLGNAKNIAAKMKKEVILSAGAINSPQILKLSGIGPREELSKFDIPLIKDLPAGNNLQDHLLVPIFFSVKKYHSFNMQESINAFFSYVRFQIGPFASLGMTDLAGFVNTTDPSGKYPDTEFGHFLFLKRLPQCREILEKYGIDDFYIDQLAAENQDSAIIMTFVIPLNPKSRGSIKLRSADPYDSPVIEANYLDDERDVKTVTRAIRLYRKLATTRTFKAYEIEYFRLKIKECDKLEYESDGYWECYMRYFSTTLYHPGELEIYDKN